MKKNSIFALCLIFFSLFCIFWLIPLESPTSNIQGDIPSSLVPTVSMIVVLCCGVFLFFLNIFEQRKAELKKRSSEEYKHNIQDKAKENKFDRDKTWAYIKHSPLCRLLLILLSISSYILFITCLGFYVATIFYLTLGLFVLNKFSLIKCFIYSCITRFSRATCALL